MGFANRIGTRFPSQGRLASRGGFLAVLATLQLPPPDAPAPPSGQQIVMLFLALALFLAFVWLLLPKKCRKLMACCGKDRP